MRELRPGEDVNLYKVIQLLSESGLNLFGDFFSHSFCLLESLITATAF